jgi:Dolichyl-phosphate-mannose-protein mannosyltransferase
LNMKPIWYVLLAAFLIRVSIPICGILIHQDDSVFYERYSFEYLTGARNLVKDGNYSTQGNPEVYRPPGYPMLLVPGILANRVTGVTIALQIVLSCLTVYLVFRIGLLMFGREDIALLCGVLYAIEPLSVVFTGLVMSETLMACVVTAFLYHLVKYSQTASLRSLLYSAVFLGLSAYIRALSWFLPVLVALMVVAWALSRHNKAMIGHAAVFLCVSLTLMGIWQIRNGLETGYWSFSGIFDRGLYFTLGGSLLAAKQGKSGFEDLRDEQAGRLKNEVSSQSGVAERFRFMRKEGLKIIADNPFAYAEIHVKGMARTVVSLGAHVYVRVLGMLPGADARSNRSLCDQDFISAVLSSCRDVSATMIALTVLLTLLFAADYLFVAVALFSKGFLKSVPVLMLIGVALYFLLISGGPHGYSRYRHVIMPIVCIFAGYGLGLVAGRLGWITKVAWEPSRGS